MKFFYNVGSSLCICLPIIWICAYLSGWLAFPLFMPGTIFVLLMCRLNLYEGFAAALCLGFVIDAIYLEHVLWGFSCLLLSSPMILFQKKSWKNVFKYRTFFWGFIINFIMHGIYIMVHLFVYHISLVYVKFYAVPLLISATVAGICGVYFLKFQNRYLSMV